jgi:type I restriction enzyme R subunit
MSDSLITKRRERILADWENASRNFFALNHPSIIFESDTWLVPYTQPIYFNKTKKQALELGLDPTCDTLLRCIMSSRIEAGVQSNMLADNVYRTLIQTGIENIFSFLPEHFDAAQERCAERFKAKKTIASSASTLESLANLFCEKGIIDFSWHRDKERFNHLYRKGDKTKNLDNWYINSGGYTNVDHRVAAFTDKRKEVDILLVVNMFLTGFDAPRLNTLYADKNLKHHGLIQAYSRTNRVFDAKKSHGNVVSYRNLKDATDEALAIFANKNAKSSVGEVIGTVIMQPYEDLVEVFRVEVEKLKAIAPDVDSVDNLIKEEDQLDFIVKFRDVLRLQNTLKTFSQFDGDLNKGGLGIDEQGLLDYQSKYLDLREDIEAAERERRKAKSTEGNGTDTEPEPPSPIQQVLFGMDFQIELIKRDEITVSYILGLIEKLKDQSNQKKFAAGRDMILDVLQSNPDLRSKRDLFETFIDEELDKLKLDENQHAEGIVITKFNEFVDQEKRKALEAICAEFSADCIKLKEIYQDFVYRGTLPDRNTLINLLSVKPKITKRAEVGDAMRERFVALADKFEDAEIERD